MNYNSMSTFLNKLNEYNYLKSDISICEMYNGYYLRVYENEYIWFGYRIPMTSFLRYRNPDILLIKIIQRSYSIANNRKINQRIKLPN